MLAKGGQNRIAGKKRLPCNVHVEMKGHGSITRLCRYSRRVTNLNDACGDKTSRGRGLGTRRACVDHLLCFAFSIAKAEEGHTLRPGRDVGGGRFSSLERKDERYKTARVDDRVWEKDSNAMMRAVVHQHARIRPSSSELQLVVPNIVMGDGIRFDG